MTRLSDTDIEERIRDFLTERLRPFGIESMQIERDIDPDGEEIFRARVRTRRFVETDVDVKISIGLLRMLEDIGERRYAYLLLTSEEEGPDIRELIEGLVAE